MSLEQDRERLREILREFSVRRGQEFTLASGRKSTVYVDARVTTCRAEAMPLIGRLFLDKIRQRGWKPEAVGGMSLGADPIVIAVARESVETPSPVNAFLVRKEAKGHGMKRQIEGLATNDPIDVVIVDDVCTTGDSTVKAIQAAREAGLRVLGAICLVDREEGARQALEDGLQCPFDSIFQLAEL
ncbi:MAG: orotate phosphoribosyltransferase [Acidimicrobiia bacterium]|nr:orotate phosphoribosyltransferase [Acidimicrobiia bacterium]